MGSVWWKWYVCWWRALIASTLSATLLVLWLLLAGSACHYVLSSRCSTGVLYDGSVNWILHEGAWWWSLSSGVRRVCRAYISDWYHSKLHDYQQHHCCDVASSDWWFHQRIHTYLKLFLLCQLNESRILKSPNGCHQTARFVQVKKSGYRCIDMVIHAYIHCSFCDEWWDIDVVNLLQLSCIVQPLLNDRSFASPSKSILPLV